MFEGGAKEKKIEILHLKFQSNDEEVNLKPF